MVHRGLAGIGCRTDGGCRLAPTACTARRDRVLLAAPRAGIMGQGLPSRTTTRTAGASRARRHRAVTLPAGRDQEVLVQAVPVQAVPVQAVPVQAVPVQAVPVQAVPAAPALPVREALVREVALQGPARAGRAWVRRTGGRRRTAGPVRPDSPGHRGQAGLRRCVSTRRLGRASRRRSDVTGPASRRSHQAR
jgi:hypothetical protein